MLLSRVAETVYWLSRYVERAENTARLIMVNANLLLDLPKGIAPGWDSMVDIVGSESLFYQHYEQSLERNVVKFLIRDRHHPSSLLSCLHKARENLRSTRSIMPRGVWEVLNDLYFFAESNVNDGLSRRGRFDYLKTIIRGIQTVNGNMDGSMSHDQTYNFIRMARNLERADMTSRVLNVRAGSLLPKPSGELKPFDDIQWKSVLESLAAYQMYRRHVHVRIKHSAVLGYLFQDQAFPRSVCHCLNEVEHCLMALPNHETIRQTLDRARNMIAQMDEKTLKDRALYDFVDQLQIILARVHNQISAHYFDPAMTKPVIKSQSPAKSHEAA